MEPQAKDDFSQECVDLLNFNSIKRFMSRDTAFEHVEKDIGLPVNSSSRIYIHTNEKGTGFWHDQFSNYLKGKISEELFAHSLDELSEIM